jgi:beta-lactamase regulating signal transducer with metallopeptidase domain/multidrug resistance efflux pump
MATRMSRDRPCASDRPSLKETASLGDSFLLSPNSKGSASVIDQSYEDRFSLGGETRDLNLGFSTEVESTLEATPMVPLAASSEPRPPFFTGARINQTICLLWLSGIVFSGLIIILRHRKFRQLILRAEPIDSPELLSTLAQLQADLGITKKIPLKRIDAMMSPAVIGWRKPVILIPSELLKTSLPDELTPIIAHELLHIRRGDLTISLLQCLAQVIWWFHPAIWIVNRRINHLREACCDGEVLHHVKISNTGYAQALLNVVKQAPKISIPKYISAVRSVEVTSQRIEKLMKDPQNLTHRTPIYGLILALGIAIFALPSAKIISAEKERKGSDTSTNPLLTATPIQTNTSDAGKNIDSDTERRPAPNFGQLPTLRHHRNQESFIIARDLIMEVKRGNLFITSNSIGGKVIPRNQLHIQSEVDGIVRQVNLKPGTRVKQGDLLLELSNDKLQSALRDAELNLDTAHTEIRQSELLVEQKLLEGKSAIQSAELELKLSESEYTRKKSLSDRNRISKEELIIIQTDLERQKQNLSFQLQSNELMKRQSEQSQRLKNLQVERIELARDSILLELAGLRSLAPMDGTIAPLRQSTNDILIGANVKAATPLAKLINVDQLTVQADYPASNISEIEEGMACRVRVNGNDHPGRIETIYPTADMGRNVTFLIEFTTPSNPSKRIIPGSGAKVYLVRGERSNVLSIEHRYNKWTKGNHVAYKISPADNTATEVEITIGDSGMGRIEISGPIKEGDQVSPHGRTISGDAGKDFGQSVRIITIPKD